MTRRRLKGPGPAKAERLGVASSGGRRVLGRHLEEALFAQAEILSEGRVYDEPGHRRSYGGSLMVTFDLEALDGPWRGELGMAQRQEVLDLLAGSVRVRARAMRFACAEAARRVAPETIGTAQIESRFSLVDGKIHLDIDVDVPVDVCFRENEA